jgi:hypothetical protein
MKKRIDHYEIIYENEKRVRYSVFKSTDLDVLAQVYAKMLQFEEMFKTFPNQSCHLELVQDYNYDADLGSFNFSDIINNYTWDTVLNWARSNFAGRIEPTINTTGETYGD